MKVISLFTGAGGLDHGLEAAGFETVAAVEYDDTACETLAENVDWPVLHSDIHAVTSAEILKAANIEVGEATLLAGGPPCQPFSKSGFWARGDVGRLGDPRASTIEEFLRVLADTKPLVYLLENVPGFGYQQKDEGLRLFKKRIKAINKASKRSDGQAVNYSYSVGVLDASDYGVPQRRTRLFVVGHREGVKLDFGGPTHGGEAGNGQGELDLTQVDARRCAWDAIGAWEDDDDPTLEVTGKWAGLLPSVPEGYNYQYFTDRGGGEPLFGWRRRYWSFLLKLAKAEPSWTITAQPGPATGPFHWRNRRLSPREMAALQTFPDEFQLVGDLRAIQRQIGNAVPSALAEYLGLRIREQLLGDEVDITQRRLVPEQRNPVPGPSRPKSVPRKYRHLIGDHEPHPGKGLGPGAVDR